MLATDHAMVGRRTDIVRLATATPQSSSRIRTIRRLRRPVRCTAIRQVGVLIARCPASCCENGSAGLSLSPANRLVGHSEGAGRVCWGRFANVHIRLFFKKGAT